MAAKKGLPDYWDRMTWPWLEVRFSLLPWSWQLVPNWYAEHEPGGDEYSGGITVEAEWLGVRINFACNLPLFYWSSGGA